MAVEFKAPSWEEVNANPELKQKLLSVTNTQNWATPDQYQASVGQINTMLERINDAEYRAFNQVRGGGTPEEGYVFTRAGGNKEGFNTSSFSRLLNSGLTTGDTAYLNKYFGVGSAGNLGNVQETQTVPTFAGAGGQMSIAGTKTPTTLVTPTTPTDARSLISTTPKAGYIKGYDSNNNYNPVYVPAGKYVPGVSLYPKPTGSITPDSLKTENKITVPGGTGDTVTPDAVVNGANTEIDNLIASLTPKQTTAEKQQQDILNKQTGLAEQMAGKGAEQLKMEQEAGISDLNTQLTDIASQIKSKTAEYNAFKEVQQGRPITMASITGSIAEKQGKIASDILLLQAQGDIIQGKLTSAQDRINRAIDLKYSSLEAQNNIYQAQLNALIPQLNKEEKLQATAQQMILNQKIQSLEDKKAEEANIQNLMLDAIKSGITDSKILSQISSAKTYNDAIKVLGQNMPSVGAVEQTTDYKNWLLAGGQAGTGMSFADWQGKTAPGEVSPYQEERTARTLQSIDELIPQVSGNTTGWGAFFLGKLPTSEARNFKAQLDTLKANITFGELTAMREASKTGGALGQVSDKEGQLLGAALGALDQLQSGDQLVTQLKKIKDSITRWQSAMGATNNSNMSDFSW